MQLRARAAVRALATECERAGVAVLPVKGIVTGALLYDDVADRPMLDADVRVRPADLERALACARRAGAEVVARYRSYRSAILMFDGMQVDVETGVGPPGLCDLSVGEMLARAERSELLGFPHLLPEIHDHALLMVVNVFKDQLLSKAQPASLEDLRRVGARLDPGVFAARAEAAGTRTLAWLVAERLGAADREHVLDPASGGADREHVLDWARLRDALGPPRRRAYVALVGRVATRPERPLARAVARAANDHPTSRLRALFHMGAWSAERLLRGRLL